MPIESQPGRARGRKSAHTYIIPKDSSLGADGMISEDAVNAIEQGSARAALHLAIGSSERNNIGQGDRFIAGCMDHRSLGPVVG
jgi:hypothetical protein